MTALAGAEGRSGTGAQRCGSAFRVGRPQTRTWSAVSLQSLELRGSERLINSLKGDSLTRRGTMRVLLVIMLVAPLGWSTLQASQTQSENWKQCTSDDPEQSLRACSALIQSGHEKGISLAKAFYDRGLAYVRKSDYDRAIQDYDQALRLNPTFADALYSRGSAYANKNDYDHAIQDYDQALQLSPT